jgi:hypothetical protein
LANQIGTSYNDWKQKLFKQKDNLSQK